MLTKRSNHGCNRVAMNNSEYIVIFGGYNGTGYTSDIHFLNLATRKWETYPDKIVLPEKPVSIYGSIVMQLDNTGCEMMLIGYILIGSTGYNRAYICKNNFQWQIVDLTGKVVPRNMVTIGANVLMPCGILN
jgi:hypothetical protein